jgi:protein SCO1
MKRILSVCLGLVLWCCDAQVARNKRLPYYGPHEYLDNRKGGIDTVYYTVPKFSFINQDSMEVHHGTLAGKPIIVEFFFCRCKSICPAITSQLARLQVLLAKDQLMDSVNILSHTVDPSHDTPEVMRAFAEARGADFTNWHFVTGAAADIYHQASQGYLVPAFPSDTADGGFFHTDQLALIDRNYHIRGYYDGTSTREVDSLYQDLKKLIVN